MAWWTDSATEASGYYIICYHTNATPPAPHSHECQQMLARIDSLRCNIDFVNLWVRRSYPAKYSTNSTNTTTLIIIFMKIGLTIFLFQIDSASIIVSFSGYYAFFWGWIFWRLACGCRRLVCWWRRGCRPSRRLLRLGACGRCRSPPHTPYPPQSSNQSPPPNSSAQ